MASFAEKVLAVVKRIPRGTTLTYKEVARRAGKPRAYRAAGNILATYDARRARVPCHRVVRTDGSIGGYRWGVTRKRALLASERRALRQSS